MKNSVASHTAEQTDGQMRAFEHALTHLQYVLIARRVQASNEPMRLTWRHFEIMALIKEKGALQPSAISKTLGLSPPSTSKYLKSLQSKTLVTTRKASQDKRSHVVMLTAQADQILESIYEGQRQNARDALRELTPEERQQFTNIAPKIIRALDNQKLRVI